MVFGGYELDPVSRWEDGVPWDHAARSLPPDFERFAPLMAGAIRRFPFLGDAEVVRLVCHPDAMTPDANPLLGPLPGRPRVLGRGRAVAQRLRWWRRDRPGARRLDHRRRPRRRTSGRTGPGGSPTPIATPTSLRGWAARPTATTTGSGSRTTRTCTAGHAACRRCTDDSRRPAPCSGRRPAGSAPDHHEPGRAWRRSGRDGARYGWTRPPWFERVVAEGRAVRDRVGIIDLSSFGKIDVVGPGALGLLQRVAANDLDVPVGSVVYTPWCDERGGMVADVTITRLAGDHLRVVTGAGFVAGDLAWLRWQRSQRRGRDDPRCQRRLRDDRTVGSTCPRRPRRGDQGPGRRRGATAPSGGGRPDRSRGDPDARRADQLRRGAGLGADDRGRSGGGACGTPSGLPAPTMASSRSDTARSTRCGWRRATATTAPT